jgi:hypothetical protein
VGRVVLRTRPCARDWLIKTPRMILTAPQYYVLDGHHRIAVARALGERWVLANITEVCLNDPDVPNISCKTAEDHSRSFRD